jgi:predicted ATP-grasp superfamily ATP-dependent carboligase
MASRGVAVPDQRRIGALDPGALVRELGMPLVVKAATGAGGSHVHIADTAAQLAAVLRHIGRVGGDWAAQELVAGPTCLVGGVFDRGRALRIYAAEKLEQHPPRTGPAIRLCSTADPALVEAGLRVFHELRWTGLASADFIRRRAGSYAFLEVNPRPWGSIAAARSAGVDLFTPFAELLAGNLPAADLAFLPAREHHVFPRYLLSPRYWRPAGVARALRDLLGPDGRDWRDLGFARHLVARLYRLRRRSRSP